MSNIARMMQRATAGAGGAGLDVDEVFSTFLYDGNGSTQTITNGIDLSGEGGLVWLKKVEMVHVIIYFIDTERGATKCLFSSLTSAETTRSTGLTAFNSNGFTLGSQDAENQNNNEIVSWTFRKAPKFFDVVTYTGNGTSGRQISHNLGSDIGMVIVKNRDDTNGWAVKHRSVSGSEGQLNATAAFAGVQRQLSYFI